MFGGHASGGEEANAGGSGIAGALDGYAHFGRDEAALLGVFQLHFALPFAADEQAAHHGLVRDGGHFFGRHLPYPLGGLEIEVVVVHGEDHVNVPLVPFLAHHPVGVALGAGEHVGIRDSGQFFFGYQFREQSQPGDVLSKTFSSTSWNCPDYRKYGKNWKLIPSDGAIFSEI